ncbi:hypothetical protein J7E93_09335 [Streptomyces sp. ISL-36]|uniref:hypothetical protein n=1 Tax=Streptomyces sp. ISL-36 TaxID=2819182 RepID=UPI001BE7D52C|nr:hypothetical protein [Streptomyces sp. ISL-36]MBT2440308.1 hypothetical protein [Streptomyces sp. ISL-36]
MDDERLDERLSDEELELFVQYLHRFANHDVDIFLNLEVGDPEHPVYVIFGRDYPPVGEAVDYRRPFADRRQVTSKSGGDGGGGAVEVPARRQGR